MAKSDLFEEMLATYPAEKRELAREVCRRFADGDSGNFFAQLLLVLDVYARYAENIPARMISANADTLATVEEIRGEIAHIAKAIETRDVNITNHATQSDELCKITQAKCNETVARVELMVKNIGSQVDTKAVVQGIQTELNRTIKAEVISPFVQHSKELGELVLPTLKEIKEASGEARTLWRQHIWKTAWAGSFLVTSVFFIVALVGIYHWLDQKADRKAAAKIAQVTQLMNYNQEAFKQLAVAQIPIQVVRTVNNDGSVISQRFAVMMQDADSAEMRDEDGHHNGLVFVTSHSPEDAIQQLQQSLKKLTPASDGK
jgi:hypothetical protein